MSILQSFKGFRSLIVHGLVLVTALLAATGVIDTPLSAVDAEAAATNAEAVLYASENLQNSEALAAGAVAAYALVSLVLRLVTTTPAAKKKPV